MKTSRFGNLMFFDDLESLLREGTTRYEKRRLTVWRRLLILVLCGCAYGCVMGFYGGLHASQARQAFYSAVKVPLLLGVTFALSLPSFFVLNSLAGLRSDFAAALSALAGGQAVLTVILASLSPMTALWYLSFRDYGDAQLFNALIFTIASLGAQISLRPAYRALIARNVLHRVMLRCWLLIYTFVGIQMGWVLRPFIGAPHKATTFFREDALSNAYVVISHLIVSRI